MTQEEKQFERLAPRLSLAHKQMKAAYEADRAGKAMAHAYSYGSEEDIVLAHIYLTTVVKELEVLFEKDLKRYKQSRNLRGF